MTPSELEATEAIRQLKARYFRLLDQQQWDELANVFTTDVVVDVTSDRGSSTPIVGRQPFLDILRQQLAGATTVHHGHMPEITIDSTTAAHGIWAMDDEIWFPPDHPVGHLRGSGWYHEHYRCADDVWQISQMVLRRQRVEIDGTTAFPPPTADDSDG